MHKLSVIIPLYNQADSIGKLLDSLTAQSIPLEIIVVNDMSADTGAEEVLKRKSAVHSIRLINNETKLYAMHSRLHGLEFAAGDYCMFADGDDDVIGTQNLEKALREVSAKQFDIGHFRVRGSDKYGKELFQDAPNTAPFGKELYGLEIFEHYFDRDYIAANLWGKLYKTDFLKKIAEKVKNLPIKRFDDKCLVSAAMLFANSYLGSTIEIYHYTPNNFWPKEKYAARILDLYTITNAMLPFMEERKCAENIKNKFLAYMKKRITVNTGQLSVLLAQEIQKNPSAVYGVLEELEPFIDKETLIQALLLANVENANKIIKNYEHIKELPHV
ncbi:MAG TPA: hypothetical protein DEB43_07620 [Desulfovibrio sp.]|nr:hypothetical protein [Desulfovibrio sp.]